MIVRLYTLSCGLSMKRNPKKHNKRSHHGLNEYSLQSIYVSYRPPSRTARSRSYQRGIFPFHESAAVFARHEYRVHNADSRRPRGSAIGVGSSRNCRTHITSLETYIAKEYIAQCLKSQIRRLVICDVKNIYCSI